MVANVMEDATTPQPDKTQETLDTLADLFLTSTAPAPGTPGSNHNPGSPAPVAIGNAPVASNATDNWANGAGEPVKLMPKPVANHQPLPADNGFAPAPPVNGNGAFTTQADPIGAPAAPLPSEPAQPASDWQSNHQTFAPEPAPDWNSPQAQAQINALPEAIVEPPPVEQISEQQPFSAPVSTPMDANQSPNTNTINDQSTQPPLETTTTTDVEAVLLGNLPGLAGPWATQYAQAAADVDQKPVLLIHADDQTTALDLIHPAAAKASYEAFGLPRQPVDVRPFVRRLLTRPIDPIGRVLVRMDPRSTSAEQALPVLRRWTWLSGADDLSVSAAQQNLGALLANRQSPAPSSDPNLRGVPEVPGAGASVVMAGCDAASAEPAAQRIALALQETSDFQGLQSGGCLPKMTPVRIQPLGSFPSDASGLHDLIQDLAGLSTPPDRFRPVQLPAPRTPGSCSNAEEKGSDPFVADASNATGAPLPSIEETRSNAFRVPPQPRPTVVVPTPQPATPSTGLAPAIDSSTGHRAPRVITPPRRSRAVLPAGADAETQPEPSAAPDPTLQTTAELAAVPSNESRFDLTALLTADDRALAGSIRLEARCPKHEEVELVLDQDGRLHLLAKHEEDTEAGVLRDAMLDLMAARAWVTEHHQLIAMTQRQLRFDLEAEPQLHLFTSRAHWATGLITRLGNALRLHLLAKVNVGDQATWFTTALN